LPVCIQAKTDYFYTGLNYVYSGNATKALEAFDKVLSEEPNNHQALFYISQILKEQGKTGKSIAVLEKSSISPAIRLFYLYKLGILYLITGEKGISINIWKDKKTFSCRCDTYYNLSDIYHSQGNMAESISELEEAIKILPQVSPKLLCRLGLFYLEKNEINKGMDYLDKSFLMEPDNLETCLSVADVFYKYGIFSRAANYYSKAIGIDPYRVKVHRRLASIYYLRKEFNNALVHFEKIAKLLPKEPSSYYNIGCIYYLKGDFDKAREQFIKSVELSPSNGKYHYNLACIYFKLGNYDSALKEFSQAVKLSPSSEKYLYGLGCISYLMKDTENTLKDFESMSGNKTDPDSYLAKGITYRDKGRIDISIEDIENQE
jgi:tetratricopeptide (TPR) repeat protein